jgi:hypothetical protein
MVRKSGKGVKKPEKERELDLQKLGLEVGGQTILPVVAGDRISKILMLPRNIFVTFGIKPSTIRRDATHTCHDTIISPS